MAIAALALSLSACPEERAAPLDAGPAAKPLAHLEAKRGAVTLERAGRAAPAELGYLFGGDALETGAEGEAKVRFSGGRLVEVSSDARLSLYEDATGIVLKVERGLVLSRVPADATGAGPAVALSIETPFGITRLGTGQNEVSVGVEGEDGRVEVLLGSVVLLSRNGESTSAAQGETLKITLGQVQLVRSGAPIELEPIQVVVFAAGKAELRKKDSKRWRAVPKAGAALSGGDAVKVKAGASVLELEGSSSRFKLARGGELLFDRSGRGGGVEESRLELGRGELEASLASGKKSRLVTGGVELVSEEGGQLTVERTPTGLEIAATAGDLTLVRDGQAHPLAAGQVATLSSKGGPPAVRPLAKEEVTLPSKRRLKVFHSGLRKVALGWAGGRGDFRVEVASDPRFEEVVLSGVVHEPYVNVSAPSRGALYWRISDVKTGAPVDEGSASFAPEPLARELGRIRNEVPDGSEKTTIFFQDKPPAVTFLIKPEEGAARYRLVVYRDGELSTPIAERIVTEERVPLEAGILSEGSYVWSGTPLSEAGEELRGGRMNKLEITYDNAVPMLTIKSPKNGERTRGRVAVAGVAPVGARVYVNGKAVPLDEKARFATTASAVGSPPVVIFRMSHGSGPEVMTVRTLRRGK